VRLQDRDRGLFPQHPVPPLLGRIMSCPPRRSQAPSTELPSVKPCCSILACMCGSVPYLYLSILPMCEPWFSFQQWKCNAADSGVGGPEPEWQKEMPLCTGSVPAGRLWLSCGVCGIREDAGHGGQEAGGCRRVRQRKEAKGVGAYGLCSGPRLLLCEVPVEGIVSVYVTAQG
jgi:hypothetical protein